MGECQFAAILGRNCHFRVAESNTWSAARRTPFSTLRSKQFLENILRRWVRSSVPKKKLNEQAGTYIFMV
jgi:hypothetical protein